MSIEKTWTDAAREVLEGKRINKVRYLTRQEAAMCGWDDRAIVLELDDGLLIWPSRDDEGNGAGAMFTTAEKLQTIPVIP